MTRDRSLNPPTTPSSALVGAALVTTLLALYSALVFAPTDRVQGDVQRLFYLHVPAALTMYLAILLVFIASLRYLQTRDAAWDELATSGAEIGLLWGTVVLLTGAMWAKPIWGAWWTWDARLTSFFILWLIFVAYVMLRSYGGEVEQVARFCAVLSILGFVGMPITHYAVEWFRTMHPGPVIMTEGGLGRGLPGSMLATFAFGLVASVVLFANLFILRLRLEQQTRRTQQIRRHLDLMETS